MRSDTRAILIGTAATVAWGAIVTAVGATPLTFAALALGAIGCGGAVLLVRAFQRSTSRHVCSGLTIKRVGDGWQVTATSNILDVEIGPAAIGTVVSRCGYGTTSLGDVHAVAMTLHAALRNWGVRLDNPVVCVSSATPVRIAEEMRLRAVATTLRWPFYIDPPAPLQPSAEYWIAPNPPLPGDNDDR